MSFVPGELHSGETGADVLKIAREIFLQIATKWCPVFVERQGNERRVYRSFLDDYKYGFAEPTLHLDLSTMRPEAAAAIDKLLALLDEQSQMARCASFGAMAEAWFKRATHADKTRAAPVLFAAVGVCRKVREAGRDPKQSRSEVKTKMVKNGGAAGNCKDATISRALKIEQYLFDDKLAITQDNVKSANKIVNPRKKKPITKRIGEI